MDTALKHTSGNILLQLVTMDMTYPGLRAWGPIVWVGGEQHHVLEPPPRFRGGCCQSFTPWGGHRAPSPPEDWVLSQNRLGQGRNEK